MVHRDGKTPDLLFRPAYVPRQVIAIDPKRPQRFRLRLMRYAVLAQDIAAWAGAAELDGRRLSLLDVGCGWGPLLTQLEAEPHFSNIDFSGADLEDRVLYKRELYREFFAGDLGTGYPEIASNRYDVVVCEQVLEHLPAVEPALAALTRVTRPGGILVIGVPIFPPPLHLARRHLVPRLAPLLPHRDTASHQQAFSLSSLLRLMRRQPGLSLVKARGFRIVSGGILRPFENFRWWWQLNRRLGELVPGLCIEVQLILRKSPELSRSSGSG